MLCVNVYIYCPKVVRGGCSGIYQLAHSLKARAQGKVQNSRQLKTNRSSTLTPPSLTQLPGTFHPNDLMWDTEGLESNKVCLIGDGFSISSLAPLSRGSGLPTWRPGATPPPGGQLQRPGGRGIGSEGLGCSASEHLSKKE